MLKPPYDAIFIDAAGTLFELSERVGVTYARFAVAQGIKVDPDRIEAGFRQAWKAHPAPVHPEGTAPVEADRGWWRQLVRATFQYALDQPLSEPLLVALFTQLYPHFAQPDAWRLFPDTRPALELLQSQAPLYVLSNFDPRLHTVLAGLGIRHFFRDVYLSSDCGASKPHPRIFHDALQKSGAAPSRCLHLGDEPNADVAGAHAVGIQARLIQRPDTSLLHIAQQLIERAH